MASATASPSTKQKCKFWDKCYRKNAAHLKQFLHPEDATDEDETKKVDDSAKTDDKSTPDATPAKTSDDKPKAKKRGVHDMSDSEGEADVEMKDDKQESKKRKADDDGNSSAKKIKTDDKGGKDGDAAAEPSPSTKKVRKLKCKYWDKCYQTNPAHRKEYAHPGDPGVTDDEDDDVGIKTRKQTKKPLHEMKDGESIDFDSGYKIKRIEDHYTCTCPGWKIQTCSPNKRTCKHLKEYLGDEFEKNRVGAGQPQKKQYIKQHIQVAVLLAQKYNEETNNPTGWWMSEKLDGVRAFWNGRCFYSRLGNAFYAPAWFTKGLPTDMHLDGELFGGRGQFQSTVSIVKTPQGDDWKKVKYFVFDAPHIGSEPFEKRMEKLQEYFDKEKPQYAKLVEQTKCTGKTHVEEELKKVLDKGGEGLMIREPKSKYEKRLSYTLLKIKKFHDAEAIVIGHEPGKGRNQGYTGALRCRMECGKEFSVGSGLSDKDRKHPPKIGTIITYKFQELTNSGSPRFPTFLGIRIDMDKPKDAVLPAKKTDEV